MKTAGLAYHYAVQAEMSVTTGGQVENENMYQQIPVKHPQVVGRVEDGEAVLVLPQQGKVKVLNEVGARIWELCDGQRTIAAIAQQIASEYAVDYPVAQNDAMDFIQSMSVKGLILLER